MKDSAVQPFAFNDRWESARANQVPVRIRRTRERLSNALIALLSEKPYDQISVQDLVQRAGVIRGTFYLHFGEKNDLFGYIMREAAEEFLGLLRTAPVREEVTRDWLSERYELILQHIRDHSVLYRTALCEPGAAPYAVHFSDALQAFSVDSVRASAPESVGKDEDKVLMIARFCAAGLTGLWKWWLETGMTVPINVVATQTADLMMNGPLVSAAIHTVAPARLRPSFGSAAKPEKPRRVRRLKARVAPDTP